MGILLAQMMVFICGILAILFSILAWRLKNDVFFYLGAGFTFIILVYLTVYYDFFLGLLESGNTLFVMINVAFVAIPVYFLIQSKMHSKHQSLDGINTKGPVTQEYLDEIINAPDEEIDYEDGINLK